MNMSQAYTDENVFKRILWLYGLYTLLSNITFLAGYYLLPEHILRGTPLTAAGEIAAKATSFWPQFGLTLFFNLGLVAVIGAAANLQQLKGVPSGYIIPIILGIVSGLVSGTNSFVSDDLSHYSVRDGLALGISIGGVEMLAYIMIIASTVKLGIYQYRSLVDWNPTKMMKLRDVRLSRQEVLCLVGAVLLLIYAAYRETAMAMKL
jgi:hypothetical protein